jgi:HD superfamily phosphodiesterase
MKRMISLKLIDIAKELYKDRDISHGYRHVARVRRNALKISKNLNIRDKTTLHKIETAALFHDLWDHKYLETGSEEYFRVKKKLNDRLKDLLFSDHDIKEIEIIINNISLSKEMTLRNQNREVNLKHLQLIRDIVSDADKLEMLGTDGIQRIIDYQYYHYPDTNTDDLKKIIIEIYEQKLNKLLNENYIRTNYARELAKPLMEKTELIINNL